MLDTGEYDAIVLARAGLVRLGHTVAISETLAVDVMLPAVGQGALCIEVRADDAVTSARIVQLDHLPTHHAALAERGFLHRLGGGCRAPIGAYAEAIAGGQLHLYGVVASVDGTRVVRDDLRGSVARPALLGMELAQRMFAAGGKGILAEVLGDN